MVGAVLGVGCLVKIEALRLGILGTGVFVEQDGFNAAGRNRRQSRLEFAFAARAAGNDRVLPPNNVAAVIFEIAVWGGDRGVVLLDAALHLGENLLLQRLCAVKHGGGICVFGIERRLDFRLDQAGIAQD